MTEHRKQLAAIVVVGLLTLGVVGPVAAHETQSVDGYDVTFGGAEEPLITGERMWLEFEIVDNETGDPVEGQAESLNASVQISGEERSEVNLSEAHGEDGVYQAPVIFTEPGDYVVHLEGAIDDTEVHTHFETEVTDRADLEYPDEGSQGDDDTETAGFGSAGVAVVAIGVAATVGAAALRRRR